MIAIFAHKPAFTLLRRGRLLGLLAALITFPLADMAAQSAPAANVDTATLPAATAVRVEALGRLTRLIFTVTQPLNANSYVLADPDRIIVDLPETEFRIDPRMVRHASNRRRAARAKPNKPPTDLIASYRFGLFAPGRSRIVIDLSGPAKVVRAESITTAGRTQFIVELEPSDRASFAMSARQYQSDTRSENAPQQTPSVPEAVPLIMIDAGHGGIDSGASGPHGVLEKDVVFEFSLALQAALRANGGYRVEMTRSTDIFVPLGERVRMARASGAALFVSVHADTLSDQPGVSGATIYTVSEKASDAQAARVAEKENEADAVAGFQGDEAQSDVNDILFELTRRETRVYSNAFARTLAGYFKEVGRLNKNPLRAAGFVVLKAPDVPSVLIELGYLSSERDSKVLLSPEWRAKAATSVVSSVDSFFRAKSDGNKQRAGAPPQEPPSLKQSFDSSNHVANEQQ